MMKRLERTGWEDENGEKRGSIRTTHQGGIGESARARRGSPLMAG